MALDTSQGEQACGQESLADLVESAGFPMSQSHARKYARSLPRYTSYPTAPHFHDGIGIKTYRSWLEAITDRQSLSLYAHIPFCDTLCWFCGCSTKHTRRYQPVNEYLPYLKNEISTVASLIDANAPVKTIHWGGGSPTILTPEDMLSLADAIKARFNVAGDAEFSVEIDPRGMTGKKIEALGSAGVTRASIGVQDFNERVQAAINRRQSFEETEAVMQGLRAAGISKINLDLIYGLPWQTCASVADTVARVVELKPDRLAVFGYAHVPWMKRHQTMIDDETLPGIEERFRQSQLMADLLSEAGYERIGMDHFALPDDPLSKAWRAGGLRRNFQGYTDDPADVLLGFGASAIGRMEQGYVKNVTPIAQYKELVGEHGLAVQSGYEFHADDHLRGHVIERLICDYAFSGAELRHRFGLQAEEILNIADDFAAHDDDGLVEWDRETFRITPAGRPFVRNVCAHFDAYLDQGNARHSLSI